MSLDDGGTEEILILESIYGDEFERLDNDRYSIAVNGSVRLTFWSISPANSDCPLFTIDTLSPTTWRSRADRVLAHQSLTSMWCEGEPAIHQWVEWLRENYNCFVETESTTSKESIQHLFSTYEDIDIEIFSSKVVVERKSRFIAHLARVHTLKEVHSVIRKIRSDPKTRDATHNIVAYRLAGPPSLDDRDDDGEGGAGDTMLYLLQRMEVTDTVAIVSRWFGGVKLGPDRFRVIATTVKDFLNETEWKKT